MVRPREFLERFHPNQKFCAWGSSHTFGGTAKSKSLYRFGFPRQNFYYVAAIAAAVILTAGVVARVGIRKDVREAKIDGAQEAAMGQLIPTEITQQRTRAVSSNGRTYLMTEVRTVSSTGQRGGGTRVIEITGTNVEEITVPGLRTYITASDGSLDLQTLVGTTLAYTNSQGEAVPTTIYGQSTTVTDANGLSTTSTVFAGLSIVTDVEGRISKSLSINTVAAAAPGAPVTSFETTMTTSVNEFTTTVNGVASTGTTTEEVAVSKRESTMFDIATSPWQWSDVFTNMGSLDQRKLQKV
ncbi:hypothetical protein L873DRAFT_1847071 [Choiromyces venosus 120613-1]|uniref:Uncharacterized protein n=1 Tax=Choiromyces venosus 120613-1 TaxID=1336337 RepID=A0A3N4J986_9PEZI|nr:hypothetical protein L873DRAFT_1847071 [Choiromyces venosus 120613-1]